MASCLIGLLPVVVTRLHVGDLHQVDWDEDPWALVTPVKAITGWSRGNIKKLLNYILAL